MPYSLSNPHEPPGQVRSVDGLPAGGVQSGLQSGVESAPLVSTLDEPTGLPPAESKSEPVASPSRAPQPNEDVTVETPPPVEAGETGETQPVLPVVAPKLPTRTTETPRSTPPLDPVSRMSERIKRSPAAANLDRIREQDTVRRRIPTGHDDNTDPGVTDPGEPSLSATAETQEVVPHHGQLKLVLLVLAGLLMAGLVALVVFKPGPELAREIDAGALEPVTPVPVPVLQEAPPPPIEVKDAGVKKGAAKKRHR